MGADIHMVLEQKTEDGWVGITDFPYLNRHALECHFYGDGDHKQPDYIGWNARERNYERFGALANVRRQGPEPKGVPDDASSLTRLRLAEWSDDAHSQTWYDIHEAISIFDRTSGDEEVVGAVTAKLTGQDQVPGALRWFGLDADELKKGEFRIICWFDN